MTRKKQPSLDQLRTFLSVYRSESLRDAAKLLEISQPTVTSHVTSLENWFDSELFVRGPRGVSPTVFAHSLAEVLSEPLDQITRYVAEGGEQGSSALRTIRIGGPREFVSVQVVPALRPFAARIPHLEFRLGQSAQLLDDLLAGQIDIALSTVRPRHPEITSWAIADEEFWLVAAPWLDVPADSFARLSAVPLIAYNKDLAIIRRYWNTVLHGEPRFDAVVVLPDLQAIKEATLCGLGLTVLPSYLVKDEVADGRLVRFKSEAEPPLNTVFLAVKRPALEARKDVAGMTRLLLAAIRDKPPDGD